MQYLYAFFFLITEMRRQEYEQKRQEYEVSRKNKRKAVGGSTVGVEKKKRKTKGVGEVATELPKKRSKKSKVSTTEMFRRKLEILLIITFKLSQVNPNYSL